MKFIRRLDDLSSGSFDQVYSDQEFLTKSVCKKILISLFKYLYEKVKK